jgi:hypothetical protein
LQTKQYIYNSNVVLFALREMSGETTSRKGVSLNYGETELFNNSMKNGENSGYLHCGQRSMKFNRLPVGMNIWVKSASGKKSHLFIAHDDISLFMKHVPMALIQMANKVEDMEID